MSRITAGRMIDRILNHADMDYSAPVKRSNVLEYINESMAEVYDILVLRFENYFISKKLININTTYATYPLPDDFYKLLSVNYIESEYKYSLDTFMLCDLEKYNNITSDNKYLKYRILGCDINFNVEPSSAGTIEIWYVPQCRLFKFETDEVNISVPVTWEDYIIYDCVSKCLMKIENDSAKDWAAKKVETKKRLESMSSNRDNSDVVCVVDSGRRFE